MALQISIRSIYRNFSALSCLRKERAFSVSCPTQESKDSDAKITSRLIKALAKFQKLDKQVVEEIPVKEEVIQQEPVVEKSFLNMLRNSEFVKLGHPTGKVVSGKIIQVVGTDLYIDFGAKFYCVCRKPAKNSEFYVRGAEVKLRLSELELTARFLGATEDTTLLEADVTLIGLVWSPLGIDKTEAVKT